MIGAFDTDASTLAITSAPGGIVTSSYFGYSGGYTTAAMLSSGMGYWVKASQAGVLHLPGGLGRSGLVASTVQRSPLKLEVQDAQGNRASVYLAKAEEMQGSTELPPLPPEGVLDVRFASNTFMEAFGSRLHEMQISSAAYPVKVRATSLGGRQLRLQDAQTGGKLLSEPLAEGRSVVVSQALQRLLLEEMNEIPASFALSQNYPNPFNPTTVIRFALPEASTVTLELYSVLGQKVMTLIQGLYPAGYHSVELNAKTLASGTYFYRIQTGKHTAIMKLMLLK